MLKLCLKIQHFIIIIAATFTTLTAHFLIFTIIILLKSQYFIYFLQTFP